MDREDELKLRFALRQWADEVEKAADVLHNDWPEASRTLAHLAKEIRAEGEKATP